MYGTPIQRAAWIPPKTPYQPRRRKSLGWVVFILMCAIFSGMFSNRQQSGHSAVFAPTPNFQSWQVNGPQVNPPQVNVPQMNIPQPMIPQQPVAPQMPQAYYPANHPGEYPIQSPDGSVRWTYAPQQTAPPQGRRN
jgi:hypothetical protein